MALGGVLRAAVDQELNANTLSEAPLELMLNDSPCTQDEVAEASGAIEVAANALDYDGDEGG